MHRNSIPRTFMVGVAREKGRDTLLRSFENRVMRASITAVGHAVQTMMERVKSRLEIHRSRGGEFKTADLYLELREDELVQRAEKLLQQPVKEVGENASVKERARPRFRNGYHLAEVVSRQGALCARFRVAERFSWIAAGGQQRGKEMSDVDILDAKMGFQGLLNSWVKPFDWSQVPRTLRAGVCQSVAQQVNSNLGLLGKGIKASFPTIEERDPTQRQQQWQQALLDFTGSVEPVERLPAREIHPAKYAEDDTRGDRLVTVDPDWWEFSSSPFPRRHPCMFVQSDSAPLYERTSDAHVYLYLPLFAGVAENSELGQLAQDELACWWHDVADQFKPLPLWREKRLSPRKHGLLVRIKSRKRKVDNLRSNLKQNGRVSNWLQVKEIPQPREHRHRRQWVASVVTSRQIVPQWRPNLLGIHFGTEPLLWWTLINKAGQLVQRGCLESNEILTAALAQQLHMQEEQGKQRWVGDRRYCKDLERRTHGVARALISLAAEHDANLALEKVTYVEKRRGGREANRRFSMWNFSRLPGLVEWRGLEHAPQSGPIPVAAHVSDYLIRFTCPACRWCREATPKKKPKGKKPSQPKTWLTDGVLHCRRCGPSPLDEHAVGQWSADLVAETGWHQLQKKVKKE